MFFNTVLGEGQEIFQPQSLPPQNSFHQEKKVGSPFDDVLQQTEQTQGWGRAGRRQKDSEQVVLDRWDQSAGDGEKRQHPHEPVMTHPGREGDEAFGTIGTFQFTRLDRQWKTYREDPGQGCV